jgi:2'-5' RNA ligase
VNEARERRRDGHRLFFALWPDPALRQALTASTREAVAQVEGNRVPPGNLHVTLAFLGPVAGSRIVDLMSVGGRDLWPRVELDFDRAEYWPKPKVLVAMPGSVPPAGLAIVDGLWRGLEPLGFAREARPWWPHLTLVRKVTRPPPRGLELRLSGQPARDPGSWKLALVESLTRPEGARYKPLADWQLAT